MAVEDLKSFETKRVNITLPRSTWDKVGRIAKRSGLSRSEVIRNFIEIFDVCYEGVMEVIDNYDGESGLTLDDYLRENGYGFLIDGKCK